MSRSITVPVFLLTLVALAFVVATPALAQGDGDLAHLTLWTVDDPEAFEEGLKAHNAWHAEQGDPTGLHTFQILSGANQGKYLRAAIGVTWASFDQAEAMADADAADSAKTLAPHILDALSSTHRVLPAMSKFPGSVGGISQMHVFELKIGTSRAFEEVIGKIHAALSKVEDWPPYIWHTLVEGGRMPTYTLVLPRETWAGFEPGDRGFAEVVAAEYGAETAGIFQAMFDTIDTHTVYTAVHRPDLSYIPASE